MELVEVYSFENELDVRLLNKKNFLKSKAILTKEGYWRDNISIQDYLSAIELLDS